MPKIKVSWPLVVPSDGTPIVKWIDLANGSMFRIFAFFSKKPRSGLMVGIERFGSFFFAVNNGMSWEYVSHKLNLPEAEAKPIADWINAQLDIKYIQQGKYREDYLDCIEPVIYAGEHPELPLIPNIIKE